MTLEQPQQQQHQSTTTTTTTMENGVNDEHVPSSSSSFTSSSSIHDELNHLINQSWANRLSCNQFCNRVHQWITRTETNKLGRTTKEHKEPQHSVDLNEDDDDEQMKDSTITSQSSSSSSSSILVNEYELILCQILMSKLSNGSNPSTLLIDYLKQLFSTGIISPSAFCQTLFRLYLHQGKNDDMSHVSQTVSDSTATTTTTTTTNGKDIDSDSSLPTVSKLKNLMNNSTLFMNYLHMIELMASQLFHSETLKQVMETVLIRDEQQEREQSHTTRKSKEFNLNDDTTGNSSDSDNDMDHTIDKKVKKNDEHVVIGRDNHQHRSHHHHHMTSTAHQFVISFSKSHKRKRREVIDNSNGDGDDDADDHSNDSGDEADEGSEQHNGVSPLNHSNMKRFKFSTKKMNQTKYEKIDEEILRMTNNVNTLLVLLIKYVMFSVQEISRVHHSNDRDNSGSVSAQKTKSDKDDGDDGSRTMNGHATESINEKTDITNVAGKPKFNLLSAFHLDKLMQNLPRAVHLLGQLLNHERIQLLIDISRCMRSKLWNMLAECVGQELVTMFQLTIHDTGQKHVQTQKEAQVSNNVLHLLPKSLVLELKQLWNVTIRFLSRSSMTNNSACQPQDYAVRSTVSNMKAVASPSLYLLINDQVFSNDLKRTCIETSFLIFDQLRQLKQMNLTNFFVEIVSCTFGLMHSVPTRSLPEQDALDFVDRHNMNTLNLYKSFLLSKVPLMFKRWLDTYCTDSSMYHIYVRMLGDHLVPMHRDDDADQRQAVMSDRSLSIIVECVQLLSKSPNQYLFTIAGSTENMLLQFACALVDANLMSRSTLSSILPDSDTSPQLHPIQEESSKLMETFAESLDVAVLSETALTFRLHHQIVDTIIRNVSRQTHRDVFLNFICLSPSLLDAFQIHGKTVELIEALLQAFRTIFETYFASVAREDDAMLKLHAQFSEIFSVLFLVILRFQIMTASDSRTLFMQLLKTCMISPVHDAHMCLARISNWLSGWFHGLDMLPTGESNASVPEESPCPIGDELIAALLDLQTQQLSAAESDPNNPTTTNFEKLQGIKSRYTPCQILEVTPYVVEQCQYVYSERGMNVLVSTQMLGFLVNFFGKYCDISVSISLKNSLHRVFTKTNSPDIMNSVTLVTQMYSSNVWNSHQFGYNMGSSIIHSILQSHIHYVNKGIQDTDVDPIIRDYDPRVNEFLHKLLQDEYTTTRKTLKYQLSHTTTTLPIVETLPEASPLAAYHILLPNTNHKLGNELHDLVTRSTSDATPVHHAFHSAFTQLVSHRRAVNISQAIFGSRNRSTHSIANSFEILHTVLRIAGIRQFIYFVMDQVLARTQLETEDVQEPVHVAEVAALILGMTAGKSGVRYLFRNFLPSFLQNWMQLDKLQAMSQPVNTSMDRILKIHNYHHAAQILAHFSVSVSIYGEVDELETFLLSLHRTLQTTALRSMPMPAKSMTTVYYLIQAVQLVATVPSMCHRFSSQTAYRLSRLATRFSNLETAGTRHNRFTPTQVPSWIHRMYDLTTMQGRTHCLMFYANHTYNRDSIGT